MRHSEQGKVVLRFGDFTLNLERRGLYRGLDRVHLTSKPLETLIFLVENRARIVEKQEFFNAIWKDTFVTEDNLVHAIREIRRVLRDNKEDPIYIQTVPRHGYRFIAEVTTDGSTFNSKSCRGSAGSITDSCKSWSKRRAMVSVRSARSFINPNCRVVCLAARRKQPDQSRYYRRTFRRNQESDNQRRVL